MKEYKALLENLSLANNLRTISPTVPSRMINLSSNDYLGLLGNHQLWDEFVSTYNPSAAMMGSCSSRLLTGNTPRHEMLEELLATLYNREASLLFNSGYHANIGILPALTTSHDLIIADKYVHASIIDGIRLSSATFIRFRHNDLNHLEKILTANRHKHKRVFIVTESIFSMDGDKASLIDIINLKNRFNCILYVDEAHAVGVRGNKGLGLAEECGIIDDIDLIVGTLGKAVASMGAFIICSRTIREVLINTARPLIFSTAIPPINCAWSHFILSKMDSFSHLRQNLINTSKILAEISNQHTDSQIIPFTTGSNESAVALAHHLQENGYYVMPIRHPTVPAGEARVRFSLTANISPDDISPLKELLHGYSMD